MIPSRAMIDTSLSSCQLVKMKAGTGLTMKKFHFGIGSSFTLHLLDAIVEVSPDFQYFFPLNLESQRLLFSNDGSTPKSIL